MHGLNYCENAGNPVLGSRVDRGRGGVHRSVMGGDLVAQNAIGIETGLQEAGAPFGQASRQGGGMLIHQCLHDPKVYRSSSDGPKARLTGGRTQQPLGLCHT